MPGTSYAMHDYLFDKYMDTFIIESENLGYPMLDGELKSTIEKYMNDNGRELKSQITVKSGHIFNTHKNPKKYISKGIPTCLNLQSYDIEGDENNEQGKDHAVVAYGYKKGKFITHFGWCPNEKRYSTVILSDATIYGYYTFEYTGAHVHSKNVSMQSGSTVKYICGCGYVQ